MARKKRTEKPEQQSIVFDSKARYKYLTGFRKRKLARRKKGLAEDLEAERKDNIDVRKEHREEVKERWKKLKSAEKHVEKLIALQDAKRQRLAIKDNAPEEGDDDDYSPVGEPLQMITFEQEDEASDDEKDARAERLLEEKARQAAAPPAGAVQSEPPPHHPETAAASSASSSAASASIPAVAVAPVRMQPARPRPKPYDPETHRRQQAQRFSEELTDWMVQQQTSRARIRHKFAPPRRDEPE